MTGAAEASPGTTAMSHASSRSSTNATQAPSRVATGAAALPSALKVAGGLPSMPTRTRCPAAVATTSWRDPAHANAPPPYAPTDAAPVSAVTTTGGELPSAGATTTSARPANDSTQASVAPSGDQRGSATTRERATIAALIAKLTLREAIGTPRKNLPPQQVGFPVHVTPRRRFAHRLSRLPRQPALRWTGCVHARARQGADRARTRDHRVLRTAVP